MFFNGIVHVYEWYVVVYKLTRFIVKDICYCYLLNKLIVFYILKGNKLFGHKSNT